MNGSHTRQRNDSRSALHVACACLLTAAALFFGYVALGWLPMLLFASGFVGGLVWWLLVPSGAAWSQLKAPYLVTLGLFAVHKWEERTFDFFPTLSRITGVPVPAPESWMALGLYGVALPWLAIPFLVARGHAFGYYLAATLFMSMGVTELAHFIFPLLDRNGYRYFPGMMSVVVLAPAAWLGLVRLHSGRHS